MFSVEGGQCELRGRNEDRDVIGTDFNYIGFNTFVDNFGIILILINPEKESLLCFSNNEILKT